MPIKHIELAFITILENENRLPERTEKLKQLMHWTERELFDKRSQQNAVQFKDLMKLYKVIRNTNSINNLK